MITTTVAGIIIGIFIAIIFGIIICICLHNDFNFDNITVGIFATILVAIFTGTLSTKVLDNTLYKIGNPVIVLNEKIAETADIKKIIETGQYYIKGKNNKLVKQLFDEHNIYTDESIDTAYIEKQYYTWWIIKTKETSILRVPESIISDLNT